jgi:hypothetical protein
MVVFGSIHILLEQQGMPSNHGSWAFPLQGHLAQRKLGSFSPQAAGMA